MRGIRAKDPAKPSTYCISIDVQKHEHPHAIRFLVGICSFQDDWNTMDIFLYLRLMIGNHLMWTSHHRVKHPFERASQILPGFNFENRVPQNFNGHFRVFPFLDTNISRLISGEPTQMWTTHHLWIIIPSIFHSYVGLPRVKSVPPIVGSSYHYHDRFPSHFRIWNIPSLSYGYLVNLVLTLNYPWYGKYQNHPIGSWLMAWTIFHFSIY